MTTKMDEARWFNYGLALAGVVIGILAGRYRLGFTDKAALVKGANGISITSRLEAEVYSIVKTMRRDMDSEFTLMKEQHAEMLRKLRRHDDELFEIKSRLERIEDK